jgi:hypothetical protein
MFGQGFDTLQAKQKPLRRRAKGFGIMLILLDLTDRHAPADLHPAGEGTTSATTNGRLFQHGFNIGSEEPLVKSAEEKSEI